MKCCKCNREATYDSPKPYCDLHWEMWFTEGYEVALTPKRLYRFRYENLKYAWRKHGRPVGWRKMLKEIKP